jgi:hypothetical protein
MRNPGQSQHLISLSYSVLEINIAQTESYGSNSNNYDDFVQNFGKKTLRETIGEHPQGINERETHV